MYYLFSTIYVMSQTLNCVGIVITSLAASLPMFRHYLSWHSLITVNKRDLFVLSLSVCKLQTDHFRLFTSISHWSDRFEGFAEGRANLDVIKEHRDSSRCAVLLNPNSIERAKLLSWQTKMGQSYLSRYQ